MPVVGHLQELFGGAYGIGAPDGADGLPEVRATETEGVGVGLTCHGIRHGIEVGLVQHGDVGGDLHREEDLGVPAVGEDDLPRCLQTETLDGVGQRLSLQGKGGHAEGEGLGLTGGDGAVGAAVLEGGVLHPHAHGVGSLEAVVLGLAALNEAGVPGLTQNGHVLGEVEDAVASAVGLDTQHELDVPPAVLGLQGLRAADDTDDGSRGGAGAVGVEPAVESIHARLDLVQASLKEGGQSDADVLEEVGAVGVAVLVEDLAQDPLYVVVLTAPRHGIVHQLAELALCGNDRQTHVDEGVEVAGGLVHTEGGGFQSGEEALAVDRLTPVVENTVAGGVIGGLGGVQGGEAGPDLGADGTAHAADVEIVGEGTRRGGMDAPRPVLTHDGVLSGGVVAVVYEAVKELIRGEGLTVLLGHVQPEDLQIEVIVGEHGVDHFLLEGQLQGHLDALIGRAQGADDGLAEEAAVDLVEVGGVG